MLQVKASGAFHEQRHVIASENYMAVLKYFWNIKLLDETEQEVRMMVTA